MSYDESYDESYIVTYCESQSLNVILSHDPVNELESPEIEPSDSHSVKSRDTQRNAISDNSCKTNFNALNNGLVYVSRYES